MSDSSMDLSYTTKSNSSMDLSHTTKSNSSVSVDIPGLFYPQHHPRLTPREPEPIPAPQAGSAHTDTTDRKLYGTRGINDDQPTFQSLVDHALVLNLIATITASTQQLAQAHSTQVKALEALEKEKIELMAQLDKQCQRVDDFFTKTEASIGQR